MRTWLRRKATGRRAKLGNTNKRDYMTVLSDSFYPQNVCCASRPCIEGRLAYYRKRLVFRLSSTPKRLLGQIPNGVI